jgi:hypothetical protein
MNMAEEAPRGNSSAGVVARLAIQRTKFKNAVETLRAERNALRVERDKINAELTRITGENATLQTKADTSVTAKRVQELEAQLRDVAHRKVFDKVAKSKGIPDDALDLFFQASGYKVEGDAPDGAAIGVLIDEQRAKPGVSRLFGEAEKPNGNPKPLPKPGAASGAGPAERAALRDFTGMDHSDVKYIMGNYDQIAEAAVERMKRGEI